MTSFPSPRPRTRLPGLRWLLLLLMMAMVVDVQGAIGAATAHHPHHHQRALARAVQAGGLDSAMRERVQAVRASASLSSGQAVVRQGVDPVAQALPTDRRTRLLAGAALLVVGLAMMVAEGFVTSFGVLGIGGVLAFVFGAGMLIDDDVPGLALSMPLAAAVAVVALGFVLIAVRLALASRRQARRSGAEAMLGHDAQVLDWSGRAGHVLLMGERWQATGPQALLPGQPVRVLAVQGLRVEVGAIPAAAPASRPST